MFSPTRPARPARGSTPLAALLVGMLAAAALLTPSCGRTDERTRGPGPMRIVVTIPPLEGLARALAPEDAQVTTLVKPGMSAHGFELTPGDVTALDRADLILAVGLGLEAGLDRYLATRPNRAARTLRAGEALGLTGHEDCDHDHHEHDHHDHGPADPHIWVDPVLIERFIPILSQRLMTVAELVVGVEPEALSQMRQSEQTLLRRVKELAQEYDARLSPLAGKAIVTHHNAFGLLAQRYGFRIASVIRPVETAEPSPAQVRAAVDAIREHGAVAVFVEPQFPGGAARRIADAAGVPVGELDPLGDGDWFAMMRKNLDELERLLGGEDAP